MAGEPITVVLTGAGGRMGRVVAPVLDQEPDIDLVAMVSSQYPRRPAPGVPLRCSDLPEVLAIVSPRVVVDFSVPAHSLQVIAAAHAHGSVPVVGTTGFKAGELETIAAGCVRSGLPALVIPNFSLGATVLARLAREAVRHLPALEIIECHHQGKRDAPSGTALRLAAILGEGRTAGIPVHSVRLPGMVAHHEIILGGRGEYLTLRHDSTSRECFIPGLLLAIRRARQCRGLVQDLDDLLRPGPGTGEGDGS